MFQSKRKTRALLKDMYGKPKQEPFDFSRIEQYFTNAPKKPADYIIPDKTHHDLDLDEVFMFVDRTISKVGQQYLYTILRTINFEGFQTKRLEELTTVFENDNQLREEAGIHLYKLSHKNAYHIPSLFLKPHLQSPDWFWVVKILPVISLLLVILIPFYPKALLVLLGVLICNYGIHYWNKKNLFQYIVSIPQLLHLNQITKELLKQEKLKAQTNELNEATSSLGKISHSLSFLTLDAKLESDAGAVVQAVTELFKALFLLEPILLFYALRQLDTKREHIDRIFQYVGMIDTAISIASLRKGLPYYCKPAMNQTERRLAAKEVYHPLIDYPVANSIGLINWHKCYSGTNNKYLFCKGICYAFYEDIFSYPYY